MLIDLNKITSLYSLGNLIYDTIRYDRRV